MTASMLCFVVGGDGFEPPSRSGAFTAPCLTVRLSTDLEAGRRIELLYIDLMKVVPYHLAIPHKLKL